MKTYNAQDGQSMIDVVLNTYGTLDQLVPLLVANNVPGVLSKAKTAQQFTFDDTQITNQALRSTFLVNNAPISSLFGSGYGRLIDENGGALVDEFGRYLITIDKGAGSGLDTGSSGPTYFTSEFTNEFL